MLVKRGFRWICQMLMSQTLQYVGSGLQGWEHWQSQSWFLSKRQRSNRGMEVTNEVLRSMMPPWHKGRARCLKEAALASAAWSFFHRSSKTIDLQEKVNKVKEVNGHVLWKPTCASNGLNKSEKVMQQLRALQSTADPSSEAKPHNGSTKGCPQESFTGIALECFTLNLSLTSLTRQEKQEKAG